MSRLRVRRFVPLLLALLLTACAASGGLLPGRSSGDEVRRTLGEPAMRWSDPDGSQQWAYPHGPMGFTTTMVFLAPDGVLRRAENVLDEAHFAAVVPGRSDRAAILRMFGPPRETMDFPARDEQTWEWRFRDAWSYPARFVVIFDRATWTVRQTLQLREFIPQDLR